MLLPRETITYQNKLYWIYRRVKTGLVKDQYIQEIKDFWGCDFVVRHKNNNMEEEFLLFLREITDLEIIN